MELYLLDINKIARLLEGTCKELDDMVYFVSEGQYELEDLTETQRNQLDSKITMCEICGLWIPTKDYTGEPCKTCQKEEFDQWLDERNPGHAID